MGQNGGKRPDSTRGRGGGAIKALVECKTGVSAICMSVCKTMSGKMCVAQCKAEISTLYIVDWLADWLTELITSVSPRLLPASIFMLLCYTCVCLIFLQYSSGDP